MLVSNIEMWANITTQIEQYYDIQLKEKRKLEANFSFFYAKDGNQNPLEGINPKHDKFFGPKVCILFIIGYPYGLVGDPGSYSISWPPPGFAEAKDRLKKYFNQWAKFELNFWGDGVIIQKVIAADSDAGANFDDLMTTTFGNIENECTEMAAYGWKWRGRLDSQPPITEFTIVLDAFYGLNSQ